MNLERRVRTSDSRCVGLNPTIFPSWTRLGSEHPTRMRLNPLLRECESAVHPIHLAIETVGLCVRFLFVVPVGVEDAPKLCRSAVRKTYAGPCQLFRAPIGSRFEFPRARSGRPLCARTVARFLTAAPSRPIGLSRSNWLVRHRPRPGRCNRSPPQMPSLRVASPLSVVFAIVGDDPRSCRRGVAGMRAVPSQPLRFDIGWHSGDR